MKKLIQILPSGEIPPDPDGKERQREILLKVS